MFIEQPLATPGLLIDLREMRAFPNKPFCFRNQKWLCWDGCVDWDLSTDMKNTRYWLLRKIILKNYFFFTIKVLSRWQNHAQKIVNSIVSSISYSVKKSVGFVDNPCFPLPFSSYPRGEAYS